MIIGILILIIIGLIVVFSIQNTMAVSISFLHWRFETSLTILIFIAVLVGVVVEQLVRRWGRPDGAAKTRNRRTEERP